MLFFPLAVMAGASIAYLHHHGLISMDDPDN